MKTIIYKCTDPSECVGSLQPNSNKEIRVCGYYGNVSKCVYRIPMILTPIEYQCWFMYDNHTFKKCTGQLESIKKQLKLLFKEDAYGGWGRLQYLGEKENENCIVSDLQFNLDKLDELIKKEKY